MNDGEWVLLLLSFVALVVVVASAPDLFRDLAGGLLNAWRAFRRLCLPWRAEPTPEQVEEPEQEPEGRPRTVTAVPGVGWVVEESASAAWPDGFTTTDETFAWAVAARLDKLWPLPWPEPEPEPAGYPGEEVVYRNAAGDVCLFEVTPEPEPEPDDPRQVYPSLLQLPMSMPSSGVDELVAAWHRSVAAGEGDPAVEVPIVVQGEGFACIRFDRCDCDRFEVSDGFGRVVSRHVEHTCTRVVPRIHRS